MTRIDSVRHAADVTKDSVRHAAEVAAPYATTMKCNAVLYGRQAGVLGRRAGTMARQTYDTKLAERVHQAREQAWAAMPPKAAVAMENAARAAMEGARAATEYTAPRVGNAVTVTRSVAGPAVDGVVLRGNAALHALRGQVSAAEIDRMVRRRIRRERAGRALRDVVVVSAACGAVVAAWKWWNRQNNPEWLIEPSEATEVSDRAAMNGSGTLTVVEPMDSRTNGSSTRKGTTRSGGRVDQVDGSSGASEQDSSPKRGNSGRRDKDR